MPAEKMDDSGGRNIRLHLLKRKNLCNTDSDCHCDGKAQVRQQAAVASLDEDEGSIGHFNSYGLLNVLNNCRKTSSTVSNGKHLDDNNNNSYGSNNKRMTMMSVMLAAGAPKGATIARLSLEDMVTVMKNHPIPCFFTISVLLFMGVEYTLRMVPPSSPPWDIGFILTQSLHGVLVTRPALNTVLAALNTVFVVMQTAYILGTLLVEGRGRPTIAAVFMFTCRGILGYSTQLPLPQGFLGSGVDFPVGNVSFFLFFSGHVAGSVIASLDMRRMQRKQMAWSFDGLNILQALRLLATRGHYTIDLAVGVGAGFLFDILAGKYEESKKQQQHLHMAEQLQRP